MALPAFSRMPCRMLTTGPGLVMAPHMDRRSAGESASGPTTAMDLKRCPDLSSGSKPASFLSRTMDLSAASRACLRLSGALRTESSLASSTNGCSKRPRRSLAARMGNTAASISRVEISPRLTASGKYLRKRAAGHVHIYSGGKGLQDRGNALSGSRIFRRKYAAKRPRARYRKNHVPEIALGGGKFDANVGLAVASTAD